MIVDMQGNRISEGMRIAAADNVCGIKIKVGTVVGFTPARVKIKFDEDVKSTTKAAHTIVKIFKQEK